MSESLIQVQGLMPNCWQVAVKLASVASVRPSLVRNLFELKVSPIGETKCCFVIPLIESRCPITLVR